MSPVDLATIELALSQLALGDNAVEHDIVSATEALGELRQRDWAVRVLDAWARGRVDMRRHFVHNHPAGCVECVLVDNQLEPDGRDRATLRSVRHCTWENCWRQTFANMEALPGRGADDARLAAARAVWPELPEAVRAELGECP